MLNNQLKRIMLSNVAGGRIVGKNGTTIINTLYKPSTSFIAAAMSGSASSFNNHTTLNYNYNNNRAYQQYSQFSMSTDQQPPKVQPVVEKKSKGSLILKLLALILVGKISYDTVQSIKAYRKGSKPLEIFLSEAWNDALYPLFTLAKDHPEVVRELGGPISIGTPQPGSTSPITELSRECLIGINFPKPSKEVDTWYLKPIPQLSQQQNNNSNSNSGKPLLVPQPNTFPSFPYCEVTSEVVLPLKGRSGKVGILHAFIYTNESDWSVLSAKVLYGHGKSTTIVEPDVKGYKHPNLSTEVVTSSSQQ